MSEYQYYEFLAIDRPLTAKEISALRALSTRAHITPVSFTNEYHWGDFKGNPHDLMRRFFDAHVYVANWMTAIFMVRLPIEAIPKKTAEAMAVDCVLEFEATETHWVITWSLDESENYDRFGLEDGRGWMARLAPVREELLRGDIRSLYVGWLAAVTREMVDDDDLEPLPVAGMGSLTAAQQALAEFLEVDEDLLAGAGIGSPALQAEKTSQKEINDWLDELPRVEVLAFMKQLLEGQGLKAERTLKNRFSAWLRGVRGNSEHALRRSVEELRKNTETAENRRLERGKREQERLNTKRRKEREAYLATLAKDFPKAWKVVQCHVARGYGLAYEDACRTLVDISEAYALHASPDAFSQELKRFMAGHMRRKALVQRLVKAGIWHEK
ncbi:MAG: hypothetical protein HYU64_19720 [Armatimonadetes bacterium]|nr:hypothetical protein [Armatimonadota bacterium]